MTLPARVALIGVALVVIAWLAVIERDIRLQASAEAGSRHGASPAALARAADDLEAARLLNPDRSPDVARATVQASRGDRPGALRVLDGVLAREPDNLLAWGLLAVYARGTDPAAVERALAARERLDPLRARGG